MAGAEADIASAKQTALKDVSDIAATSAIDVVSQLTGLKVNKTDAKSRSKKKKHWLKELLTEDADMAAGPADQ